MAEPSDKEQQLALYANLDQLAQSMGTDLGMQSEANFEEFLDNSVQLIETEMHATGMTKNETTRLVTQFRLIARSAWKKSNDKPN